MTDATLVRDWVSRFDRALAAGDARAAARLFLPDGHWRDLVSFTWQLRTFSGIARIEAAFGATLPVVRPGEFRPRRSPAPRRVHRGGAESVEAFLDFRTAYGSGEAVVRIVRDPDGEPRAWVLLTALRELDGCEERSGPRRPRGEACLRDFGGPTWLDQRAAALEYATTDPTVLIVGGGQAGLTIAARLGCLGVDALVVDRLERVGDTWRNRYRSLVLHNEVGVNHLPYMPFPDTWPVYVPKDKIANWFEAYVDAMEINFWTSTEFVGAAYDAGERRWRASVRRGDAERVLRPRHIVMATGVSGIPFVPAITGLEDFAGEVIHSSAFRDGSAYGGRAALVIGAGNSGHDVAQDLHAHGASVIMVQRGSTTVVQVETAQKAYALYSEGLSLADCDLISAATPYPVMVRSCQLLTEVIRRDDADLIAGLTAAGFLTDYGDDDTGFQLKYLRRGGGFYFNVGCSDLIVEGAIAVVRFSDIERMVPGGARLRNGSVVPADVVVFATGYRSQQELVRTCFGDEIAERVGPIWGCDEEGELRNVWKRTAQPGLWFHAGNFAQARIFSRFLALQIKACAEGLIEPARDLHPARRSRAAGGSSPPGANTAGNGEVDRRSTNSMDRLVGATGFEPVTARL
jgi:cation diffusion facilitator CzcD-associated flavoprotein CzcO